MQFVEVDGEVHQCRRERVIDKRRTLIEGAGLCSTLEFAQTQRYLVQRDDMVGIDLENPFVRGKRVGNLSRGKLLACRREKSIDRGRDLGGALAVCSLGKDRLEETQEHVRAK
jgi:hypothetical protein